MGGWVWARGWVPGQVRAWRLVCCVLLSGLEVKCARVAPGVLRVVFRAPVCERLGSGMACLRGAAGARTIPVILWARGC